MKSLDLVMLKNGEQWSKYVYICFKTKHMARGQGKEAITTSFEKASSVDNIVMT